MNTVRGDADHVVTIDRCDEAGQGENVMDLAQARLMTAAELVIG